MKSIFCALLLSTARRTSSSSHAAIRQLSPDQQEMVRAIYFENVSVNDYAARTGVTQSAISHRLQTVKKKLKKLLG